MKVGTTDLNSVYFTNGLVILMADLTGMPEPAEALVAVMLTPVTHIGMMIIMMDYF